jgi:hypothetical protein
MIGPGGVRHEGFAPDEVLTICPVRIPVLMAPQWNGGSLREPAVVGLRSPWFEPDSNDRSRSLELARHRHLETLQ